MLGEQIIKIISRVPENFTKNTQGVLINIGIIIVIILLESLLGGILTKIEKNNEKNIIIDTNEKPIKK
jgi:hypothetical protein